MKTIKINKRYNEVGAKEIINEATLSMSGDSVCLVADKKLIADLIVGGKLHFEKNASGNSGEDIRVCEFDVVIREIVDDNEEGKRYVYFDYIFIEALPILSYKQITSPEGYQYKFYFKSNTLVAPGDFEKYKLELGNDYVLYVRRGGNILTYTDLALCYPNDVVRGVDIVSPDGYCCEGETTLFNYETMERNSILSKNYEVINGEDFIPMEGDEVFLCTNPFYFTNEENEVILFDGVTIEKFVDFMNVGVVLEQDYDAKRMYQEYQVNDLFVKKIKKNIIPDFIDLEKVKLAPAYEKELATGLTFNMHFRERVMKEDEEYVFADTWYIGEDTTTWNTDDPDSSDLMGYLGFTDEDIFNQKNRVKKSFLRVSFYDNTNPLTQHLLYYSTIFFDSGELYGKFIKRKAWLEDNGYDTQEIPVVWSPMGLTTGDTEEPEAVTSQITVNDEYDNTKSGEGFNLYLFKEDAPVDESGYDIYMKVEFNHAGYGRTIPLVLQNNATSESIENYLQNIYIKVNVSLTEDGYVYSFSDDVKWENERLIFNLFEPMIEKPLN